MNILQFATNDCWAGGEQMIKNLVKGFKNKGHKVFLATKAENKVFLKMFGNLCEIVYLPFKSSLDLKSVLRLVCFVKKQKIDILAVHDKRSAWLAVWVKILARRGKIVFTWHTVAKETDKLKTDFWHRFFFRKIDVYICVSKLAKEKFLAWNKLVLPKKVYCVYNGVDTTLWQTGNKIKGRLFLKCRDDDFLIGYVGRAFNAPEKRLDVLLDATYLLKKAGFNFKTVIVGDAYDEKLCRQIKELNLQDTVLMFGSTDDVVDVMQAIDVFVSPSEREACSVGLLEAMASQLPVVIAKADYSSSFEIVQDKINGLLFEQGNVNALKESLQLLMNDKELRQKLGKKACETVFAKFSLEKLVENTMLCYKNSSEYRQDCL